jgi:hypothetical protein
LEYDSLEAGPGGADLASSLGSSATKHIFGSSELDRLGSASLYRSSLVPSLGLGRTTRGADQVTVLPACVKVVLDSQRVHSVWGAD